MENIIDEQIFKALETRLEYCESQYQRLIDGLPDILYSYSLSRGGIFYSPSVTRILGYTPEYLLEHSYLWNESIHAEDRGLVSSALDDFLQGKSYEIEYRVLHANGHWVWLRDRSISRHTIGEEQIIQGIASDVTELHHTMARLAARNSLRSGVMTRSTTSIVRTVESSQELLFDNMLNGYAYCRMAYLDGQPVDFIYLKTNKAFEKQTGLKNVVGKWVSEVITGIQQLDNELLRIYGRVAQNGRPERFEYHLKSFGIWFDVSVFCPEQNHFIALFDNINDRKRVELENSHHLQWLHHALRAAKSGVWEWDLATDANIWSDEIWDLYGYEGFTERERIPSFALWSRSIHPDDRTMVEQTVLEVAHSGAELHIEWRVNLPDGQLRWLVSRGKPICNEKGAVTKYIGVVTDITELKQMEAALRNVNEVLENKVLERTKELNNAKEKYRSLVENINDVVWETDSKGRFTYLSPVFYNLLGYQAAEFIGKTPLELTQDIDGSVTNFIRRALTDGIPFASTEVCLQHRDGNEVIVEVSGTPIIDTGTFLGFRGIGRDITARKSLEKEREQYFKLFYTAQELMAIIDLDGCFREVNRHGTELLGYTQQELAGHSYLNLVHPDDRQKTIEEAILLIERGECTAFENRYVRKDGSICWLSWQSIKDTASNAIYATARDVTIIKQHQAGLLEQKLRLDSIIKGTNAGTWEWNIETGETILNERWAKIVGYTLEELSPVSIKTWEQLAHPDDLKTTNERLKNHFSGESEQYECECRMKHKDGHWVWVADRGSIVSRTPDGKPLLMSGTHHDITTQKEAEIKVSEYAKFLQTIADAMPGMVAYWDSSLHCTFANARYKDWFGRSSEQMHGIYIRELLGEQLYADNEPYILNALRGEQQQFERSLVRIDGSRRNLLLHYIPDNAENTVRGFFVLAMDVTALKEAQLKIEQVNHELVAATRQAEAANKAKSEFLANMSHEIRTPMNGIVGILQLLQMSEMNQEQQEFLDKIDACADDLLAIINDILDLSKIEAGKLEIEHADFSLATCLKGTLNMLASRIVAKGLQYSLHLSPSLPENVIGDQLRVKQIILNLLSNALKFTEQGSITLAADVREQQGDRVFIDISVRDTGIGMSPETVQKVFLPFTQADAGIARKYGGTGLGLTICSRLADGMGGSLTVTSCKGEGSTFHLFLPFSVSSPRSEEVPRPFFSPASRAWEGRKLRVLVVDDENISTGICLKLLQSMGHTGSSVISGYEALERLERESYDLILMDVHMPGMAGDEVTAMIREGEKKTGNHIPIIALTAYALRGDKERLLASGFDGYIAKPFRLNDLKEEMRRVVEGATC